jgi:RHS repeat-associated protein
MTLSANATDSDGAIANVAFYRGSTLIGNDSTAPYSFSWSNVAAGTYSITSRATDNLGAVTISAPITVTVNPNVLPTVNITAPAAGSNQIAPAIIALTASANDADGTIARVYYYRDGVEIGSSLTAPYAVNWSATAAGTYSITAKALDNKGGLTTSSALAVTVKPNQLPTVGILTPANNATFAAPGLINLTASAADSDGVISKVSYYSGTTLLRDTVTAPYAFAWSNVAAGSYVITAKVTDNKGGVQVSAPINLTVNPNVAPTVSVTSPVSNSTFYGPGTMTLSATALDSDGIVKQVAFYNGNTHIGTATAAPFTFAWTNPALGSKSITARATDDKSITTVSTPVAVEVKAAPIPSVSISSPANNARYTAPATLAFTATASIAGDTINKVEYFSGANMIGRATTSPYTVTLNNILAGNYAVTAIATGTLGGTATSGSVALTVVATAAPTISLTATPATAQAPAAIALNATVGAVNGTVASVEFYNGSTLLGFDLQAPYSYSWSGVAAGTYVLTAKAFDNSGAVTTSNESRVTVTAAAGPATTQVFYIYSDQVGTAREITDASGVKVWQADPDPFGAIPPNENPAGRGQFVYNQRFPGQYYDRETGLHYNYFRDYDPQTGRYVQSDPIGLDGGVNTYGYVGGSPLNRIDPTGLKYPADHPVCKGLRDKMGRKNGALDKRYEEYVQDKGRLPERVSPNELLSSSRRGHRTLINMEASSLRTIEKRYADECEDEPPPPPDCPATEFPWGKTAAAAAAAAAITACIVAEPCGAFLLGGAAVGGAALQ